jgi:hypothetical protein
MVYTINHEDIWIESTEPLSWRQFFDETLNYENLYINGYNYTDYRPTRLQFHLSSDTIYQNINVRIKYANRLTRTHAKHAAICKYDEARKQWVIINHTLNTEDKTLDFTTNSIGVFGVFINHYWYSSFTQRIADEYPNWTKIRQSSESVGQLFLNYFGIELETVKDYLDWISEQKYIGTVDLHAYDWIKMYPLPDIQTTDDIKVYRVFSGGATQPVTILETIKEFFYNDRNEGGIIDYQEKKFYTSRNYGVLRFDITQKGVTTSYTIEPVDYHVWNALDEFGLLLGVERMHLEKNADFKERILDVFRYPSGTHDIGLTHGIARELGLIQRKDRFGKKLIWQDDNKDLYLKNVTGKIIDIRTLRVDNQPLQENEYEVDERGNIRIYARKTGQAHEISFIYGIEKYQLYDKTDEALYKMMFQPDGQATPTLLNWVEYINTVAPVMWDRFNWDEGFWDTIDKQLTGLGYVPNIWDSNIEVWKDYVFESER